MSVLVGFNTRLVVQGMSGKTGAFHAKQMVEYGTNVVAGVVPGRGGTKVAELETIPMYDTASRSLVEGRFSSLKTTPRCLRCCITSKPASLAGSPWGL